MTANDWKNLKKPIIDVEPEKVDDITPPEYKNLSLKYDSDGGDNNPFALQDEATTIEAARDLITVDADLLKMVAQQRNPKAFAALYAVAHWERMEKASQLADLDEKIGDLLLMFGCSKEGKNNRAQLFAEVLKSQMNAEFQLQKSTGDKLMGR